MMGVSSATSIMIGVKIGEGDHETAARYGKKFVKIGFLLGMAVGACMAVAAPFIPRLFNVPRNIYIMTSRSLLVGACLVPIKSVNMNIIVGILRSGGDTKFSMFTEMLEYGASAFPCAFIGALLLTSSDLVALSAARARRTEQVRRRKRCASAPADGSTIWRGTQHSGIERGGRELTFESFVRIVES
jgi:Na+-driven multidrug efflux pump